jgi:hypothetical protein
MAEREDPMSGRDEQLGRKRDESGSRHQTALPMGKEDSTAQPAERPPGEKQAEADLLKTSGGDPFTQESD